MNGRTGSHWLRGMVSALLFAAPPFSLGAVPYVDNGDGTVTDSGTNLRWQKCSAGLSGASCGTGSAGGYTWQSALSYCNNLSLASKTWRLPSVNELKTLAYRSRASGAGIDPGFFPAAPTGNWTSTTLASSPFVSAWVVSCYDGTVNVLFKTDTLYVRCVSTGP